MTREELLGFICEVAILEADELAEDAPLFSSALIDSLHLLEIISFVEKSCGIRVQPGEVTLEHWDSVNRILAFAAARSG